MACHLYILLTNCQLSVNCRRPCLGLNEIYPPMLLKTLFVNVFNSYSNSTMYFRQVLLLILLIVSLSPYPNNARYPRATDDMKVQKAPDSIPELNGHIPDYISFDAAAPIIDNSEEDEEDEEGLDDMETEGSAEGVDHNFLSPEFNPEQ